LIVGTPGRDWAGLAKIGQGRFGVSGIIFPGSGKTIPPTLDPHCPKNVSPALTLVGVRGLALIESKRGLFYPPRRSFKDWGWVDSSIEAFTKP